MTAPSAKTSDRTQSSWFSSEMNRKVLVRISAFWGGALYRGWKVISLRMSICSPRMEFRVMKTLLMVRVGRRTARISLTMLWSHWKPATKSSQRFALAMNSRWPVSRL